MKSRITILLLSLSVLFLSASSAMEINKKTHEQQQMFRASMKEATKNLLASDAKQQVKSWAENGS